MRAHHQSQAAGQKRTWRMPTSHRPSLTSSSRRHQSPSPPKPTALATQLQKPDELRATAATRARPRRQRQRTQPRRHCRGLGKKSPSLAAPQRARRSRARGARVHRMYRPAWKTPTNRQMRKRRPLTQTSLSSERKPPETRKEHRWQPRAPHEHQPLPSQPRLPLRARR